MNFLKLAILSVMTFLPAFASAQWVFDGVNYVWRGPATGGYQQPAPRVTPAPVRMAPSVPAPRSAQPIGVPANPSIGAQQSSIPQGSRPILWTDGSCSGCRDLQRDYGHLFDFYVIKMTPDRTMNIPAIEANGQIYDPRSFFKSKAEEFAKLQKMPLPTDPQPLKITQEADGNYYINGTFDRAQLPYGYKVKDNATGKEYSISDPEFADLLRDGKLVFSGIYDPKTREFAKTNYTFKNPSATTDPKIVPDPRDASPAPTGSGFYIKPRPSIGPNSTEAQIEAAAKQKEAAVKAKEEQLRKMREQMDRLEKAQNTPKGR